MKIHITGNAGSGKSTVSRTVSDALNLPLYGLDKIVWKENWQKTPAEERAEKELKIIMQSNWIIDGVSREARQAADFVVFIDRPPLQCALRALKRNIPYLFKSRPELPDNCIDIRILPSLLKLIFRFNSHGRPSILRDIAAKPNIILKTDSEVKQFLSDILRNKTLDSISGPSEATWTR